MQVRGLGCAWVRRRVERTARAGDRDAVAAELLGFVLDHDGGFGATPDELPLLRAAFATTARMWLEEYGLPYVGPGSGMTKCTRNCQSRCWHACKTKRYI